MFLGTKQEKFVKLTIFTYVLAGVVLFVGATGEFFPDFYMPYLMSALAFVSAFLVLLPRLIFRKADTPEKTNAIAYFQTATAFGLIINGLGGLGLYKLYTIGIPYDKFTHVVTPFVFTFAFTYLLRDWFKKDALTALLMSSVIVLVGGFLWEGLEYTSDMFLGTHLFGGGSSEVWQDTVGDVVANFLGVSTASFLIFKKERQNKNPKEQ